LVDTTPRKALTTLSVSNNPTTRLGVGSAFIIQNSSGNNLVVIDATGNMDIAGTITQSQEPTSGLKDFIIQNSTGGLNLVITCRKSLIFEHLENWKFSLNPAGNLLIKNVLTQNQGSLSPTLKSSIIQNSTGATVAYVKNQQY